MLLRQARWPNMLKCLLILIQVGSFSEIEALLQILSLSLLGSAMYLSPAVGAKIGAEMYC